MFLDEVTKFHLNADNIIIFVIFQEKLRFLAWDAHMDISFSPRSDAPKWPPLTGKQLSFTLFLSKSHNSFRLNSTFTFESFNQLNECKKLYSWFAVELKPIALRAWAPWEHAISHIWRWWQCSTQIKTPGLASW